MPLKSQKDLPFGLDHLLGSDINQFETLMCILHSIENLCTLRDTHSTNYAQETKHAGQEHGHRYIQHNTIHSLIVSLT